MQEFNTNSAGSNPPPNIPVDPQPAMPPPPVPPSQPIASAPTPPPQPMPAPSNPPIALGQAPLPASEISQHPSQRKSSRLVGAVVAVLSVLIIFGLAFAFYYYATKQPAPGNVVQPTQTQTAEPKVATPPANATQIVVFGAPDPLPTVKKSGSCWVASLAAPYRNGAWRCMVGSTIYDPCFETNVPGSVFCQMNPTVTDGSFLITLTKPLPTLEVVPTPKDTWAWFLTLADGTMCSPFTGTKPVVAGEAASYGCRSADKTQQVMLLGDLVKKDQWVWTAKKVVTQKQGTVYTVKSTQEVELGRVWQ